MKKAWNLLCLFRFTDKLAFYLLGVLAFFGIECLPTFCTGSMDALIYMGPMFFVVMIGSCLRQFHKTTLVGSSPYRKQLEIDAQMLLIILVTVLNYLLMIGLGLGLCKAGKASGEIVAYLNLVGVGFIFVTDLFQIVAAKAYWIATIFFAIIVVFLAGLEVYWKMFCERSWEEAKVLISVTLSGPKLPDLSLAASYGLGALILLLGIGLCWLLANKLYRLPFDKMVFNRVNGEQKG